MKGADRDWKSPVGNKPGVAFTRASMEDSVAASAGVL